jgi:tRNA-modifying protein YgfZ
VDELERDYRTLRDNVGAVRVERDAVRVAGPDAVSFLHGQCSQDIAGLAVGASAWSLVLQPQGKVDALVRVTRTGPDTVVVDTDGGWGEALVARLNRFKLRVKADIEPLPWACVALRGPGAIAAGSSVAAGADLLVVDASWPGLPGVDLLGVAPLIPPGVAEVSLAAYDLTRIEAGVPVMGAELDDRTIPAETGIVERTVSFTKGCYTGQELVARIDSRGGHVPRHLRGLLLPDGVVPPGTELRLGPARVGTVTSSAARPGGGAVGLAYVSRNVEPPAEVAIRVAPDQEPAADLTEARTTDGPADQVAPGGPTGARTADGPADQVAPGDPTAGTVAAAGGPSASVRVLPLVG